MARRPEDMGRNMPRPSNSLSQLAPSFPAPAINELAPPITAPHQSSYLFGEAVSQAYNSPFQQGAGAGQIHSSGVAQPLDVAALVAAVNNFESRPVQPNGHITSWSLGQSYGPQRQQQQLALRYPGPQPIGPSNRDVWGLLPPMSPAPNARFTQQQQPTGAVASYGSIAGAPLVGSSRYGGPTWAPRPADPAYLAGTSSARSAQTGLASKPTKSFEEFLREQGIHVPVVADELPVLDDTEAECNALVAELLRGPAEEPGRMETAGLQSSAARNWLLPPAVGFRFGPSRDHLGLGTVRVPLPSFGAGAVGGRSSYGRATAAAAREERRKKMAEKKVAAGKARAQKLAAARGSPEGT